MRKQNVIQDAIKTFLAMVPAELEKQLKAEARAQVRSRNAQLVAILKERYESKSQASECAN